MKPLIKLATLASAALLFTACGGSSEPRFITPNSISNAFQTAIEDSNLSLASGGVVVSVENYLDELLNVDNNISEENMDNILTAIDEGILDISLLDSEYVKNYLDGLLDGNATIINQEWKIDGIVTDLEEDISDISVLEGEHNVSVEITDEDGNITVISKEIDIDEIVDSLKEDENLSLEENNDLIESIENNNSILEEEVIVNDDTNISYGVEILSDIKPLDIKSAQYYSIDDLGNVLNSKIYSKDDFYYEDDALSLNLENKTGEEFYSHLTISLEDGNFTALSLQDGIFTELPLTIILNNVEESIDKMSGLHSLSFHAYTSKMIDSDQVLSFQAIVGSGFVDSNYNRFNDNTVYEWGDDYLFMKSFALGYEDSNISRTSICLELQAVPDQVLVCSNLLLH